MRALSVVRRFRAAVGLLSGAVLVPVLAACGGSSGTSASPTPSATGPGKPPAAHLTVLAAASLTDEFKTAGAT